MKQETDKNQACPRKEIAAYIDGELSPREEFDLEMHFAVCPTCAAELNEQKKLLCVLDLALENEEQIKLPENFTKVVVVNAESSVQGLRCPRERSRAFLVCVALFMVAIFGLGSETAEAAETLGNFGVQLIAVGGFFVHLIHDITIAVTAIFRSLCLQFVFNSAISGILLGIGFIASFLIFSRLILRDRRF